MATPSGIARCHFLAEGVAFVFDSREEALAIADFNRIRDITLTAPIVSGAKGERLEKVMNAWKGSVYPEMKISDIQRLNKYRDQFKQYEKMDLRIVG